MFSFIIALPQTIVNRIVRISDKKITNIEFQKPIDKIGYSWYNPFNNSESRGGKEYPMMDFTKLNRANFRFGRMCSHCN